MTTALTDLFALTAADVMSRDLVVIPREMSLEGAARMLSRSGVTGAPVIDSEGRCIGVLSATDFMTRAEHLQNQDKKKREAIRCANPGSYPWVSLSRIAGSRIA